MPDFNSRRLLDFCIMKKPKKNKKKCGMYYYTYIPWAFKNNKIDKLDFDDIEWYKNVYLKEKLKENSITTK
tara:strand:+ start:650 stop:862 length:213 start_codon:yes stop_codon:yes gene_type:complete